MCRNEIITQLFRSKEFNDCINKMQPEYLRDDLKQEVMLIVCEKEEHFLQALHHKGELKYWVVRIILNMVQSDTSPFFKKYRMVVNEYEEIPKNEDH